MSNDYQQSFVVTQSSAEVFAALVNPRLWWSQNIEGHTDALGELFFFQHADIHRSTFKITEFVPNKKVLWHVLDTHIDFVADGTEWTQTDVVFEIEKTAGQTRLTFTHVGLVSDYECFDSCTDAWRFFVGTSLYALVTTGQGQPLQAA